MRKMARFILNKLLETCGLVRAADFQSPSVIRANGTLIYIKTREQRRLISPTSIPTYCRIALVSERLRCFRMKRYYLLKMNHYYFIGEKKKTQFHHGPYKIFQRSGYRVIK